MLNLLENHRCFNGHQEIYSHGSFSNKCKMQFALYTPDKNENIPVLYFLSGITCTEQNFIQKSGYQKFASEHQMAIVVPDTSPRGKGIPDSESYKLGWGAGFYLNATEDAVLQAITTALVWCLRKKSIMCREYRVTASTLFVPYGTCAVSPK